jgi:hypothetical protein
MAIASEDTSIVPKGRWDLTEKFLSTNTPPFWEEILKEYSPLLPKLPALFDKKPLFSDKYFFFSCIRQLFQGAALSLLYLIQPFPSRRTFPLAVAKKS